MAGNSPIQYSGPTIAQDVDWNVRRHLQLLYQKLGNHTQAFQAHQDKITALEAEIAALKAKLP